MKNLEFKVGVMIIVGIIATIAIIFFINGWSSFRGHYNLKVRFSNIDNLKVGSAVNIAGVKVGEISDIKLINNQAILKLKIENKYKIPINSEAFINSSGMLGEKFISIVVSENSDKFLKNDDLINGHSPIGLDSIIKEAVYTIKEVRLLIANFNDVAGNKKVKKSITSAFYNLNKTMENLNKTTGIISKVATNQQSNLTKIVNDLAIMANNMASASKELNVLLTQLDSNGQTSNKIQSILTNLKNTTSKANKIAGDIQGLTGDKELKQNLKTTLKNTSYLTSKANKVVSNFRGKDGRILTYQAEVQSNSLTTKPRFTGNVLFHPNPNSFFLAGINNHNSENTFNLQYGKRVSKRSIWKTGMFASAVGTSWNQFIGNKFSIEGILTNKSDENLQLKARYFILPQLSLTYQYRNLFNRGDKGREFNWGVEAGF